jgi:hypothetical protein
VIVYHPQIGKHLFLTHPMEEVCVLYMFAVNRRFDE